MFLYILLCISIISSINSINPQSWIPQYSNQNSFDEPFDFVNQSSLPNLVINENIDWISSSGTSLPDLKKSYFAFSGTRQNYAKDYSAVYTQKSGIVVLCEAVKLDQNSDLNIKCKTLDEKSLSNNDGIYFGAVVRSAQFSSDTVAFIYCDPLWFDEKIRFKDPVGKCKLSFVKDFNVSSNREFKLSSSNEKCLGGFSVDIHSYSRNLDVIFGLPFCNSTVFLKQAQTNAMGKSVKGDGTFFNYGYAVSFSGDGAIYVSSPVSDETSAFVQMVNAEKFYPPNQKTQNYGGFGTSLDTIKVSNNLYAAVIGAPYQNKQNQANVGAVFLACRRFPTDMVSGENKDDYFGYAVARIGNVDYSEPETFAVSAPRLNSDKPGKIYIFKSTSNCKIEKKPFQIYQSDIKGFGVSISRGFDIDFNGWPDFFVTSMNSSKPSLFKMPDQAKVSCFWIFKATEKVFAKGEIFDVSINFDSESQIDFNDYIYQVALDYMNKGEKRFELKSAKYFSRRFNMKVKLLGDVLDMDLKSTPLQIAVKGTRSCKEKKSETCFSSKSTHMQLTNSNTTIKLSQYRCVTIECLSDLVLQVRPDPNGNVIYLGNIKNYLRKLELIISNGGPELSPRIFMSITLNKDMSVLDVKCNSTCTRLPNGQVIIKETRQSVKITVDVLYSPSINQTDPKTSVGFKIWGMNNDSDLLNNRYQVDYSILFKPNIIFSSNKVQSSIIDERLKPSYFKNSKVSVHHIGTDMIYSYLIENKGPELKNVKFKFKFPYKTSDNRILLYVMNKVRYSIKEEWVSVLPVLSRNNKPVGICSIADEIVNPLKIVGVETHQNESAQRHSTSDRKKRSVDVDEGFTHIFYKNGSRSTESLSQSENAAIASSSDRSTLISCNSTSAQFGTPICAEVVCDLDILPMNSVFNFDFRTWLYAKTFFDSRVQDIVVMTSMESNLGDLPSGVSTPDDLKAFGPFHISQKVIFSKMDLRVSKPLWPIIVAIIIGIILLVIIVIIAHYCGFFKRKRLRREAKAKRETRMKNLNDDKCPLNST